ncbi:ROK family transcriptional regulator [Nonomuraea sp. NPDC050328]|uniref:ROK family transcriptional regulator n=1 Tax=Nonomuraea sp. NPDC050328 TaxID=3364361 RepID=UPI0037AA6AE6
MRTATPALARAINDRLALDLFLTRGPLTAPQLRDLTGLSRPTVSDLIERLQGEGLIEVTGERGEERRGPNARVYGLVAARAYVAGVDLRRNAVHATVADITGQVLGSASIPLPGPASVSPPGPAPHSPPGPAPVSSPGSASVFPPGSASVFPPDSASVSPPGSPLEVDLPGLLAAAVARAAQGRPLHHVVIGAPGVVHPHTGLSTIEGLPGWRPDLLDAVRRSLSGLLTDPAATRVTMENEVNLAAIAEHRLGAGAGHDDFALLWLDDGVGAALVLDGRLRRGASGGAGEVGLIEVGGEPICCLVQESVGAGLADAALAECVVHGAFSLAAVVDPGLIVLGGATGRERGAGLAELVQGRLAELYPPPTLVRASTVEGNAILEGAVLTALDRVRDEVFG